jgi:hypothetical protein
MRPRHVQCYRDTSGGGSEMLTTIGESTTIGELTSGKSSDFGVWFLKMVQRYGESTYEQGESGRGERR